MTNSNPGNAEVVKALMDACKDLSSSQELAVFDAVLTSFNVMVLAGGGGTGKTTTARKMATLLKDCKGFTPFFCGTTGVAGALHNAPTAAALFGLGGGTVLPNEVEDQGTHAKTRASISSAYQRSTFRMSTEKLTKVVIFLDEFSMASSQDLVIICQILEFWKIQKPGREYKLVLVGDVQQLEPVDASRKEKRWKAYVNSPLKSALFQGNGSDDVVKLQTPIFGYPADVNSNDAQRPWVVVYRSLQETHRTKDPKFTAFLKKLGRGEAGPYPFAEYLYEIDDSGNYVPAGVVNKGDSYSAQEATEFLHVFSTNRQCTEQNDLVLAQMLQETPDLKNKTFKAKISVKRGYKGTKSDLAREVMGAIPVEQTVYVGSKVMCRKNISANLRNGTVAKVVDITAKGVKLQGLDGQGNSFTEVLNEIELDCPTDGEGQALGSIKCMPIHLAYALTYWKTQGITWPGKLVMHISGKFPQQPGLGYVGASRVTRSEDLLVVVEEGYRHAHATYNPEIIGFLEMMDTKTLQALNNEDDVIELDGLYDECWTKVCIAQRKLSGVNLYRKYFLGNLTDSYAVDTGATRKLTSEEENQMDKLLEDKDLMANADVVAKIALTPIMRFANRTYSKIKDDLNKYKGQALDTRKNVLADALSEKPAEVQKAIYIAAATQDLFELLATPYARFTDEKLTKEFFDVIGTSSENINGVEETVEAFVEFNLNESLPQATRKRNLHNVLAWSKALMAHSKEQDEWIVEVADVRRHAKADTALASVTETKFYLPTQPVKEQVVAETEPVEVELSVEDALRKENAELKIQIAELKEQLAKAQKPTEETTYQQDVKTCYEYALSKKDALPNISHSNYHLVTTEGGMAVMMAGGLKDAFDLVQSVEGKLNDHLALSLSSINTIKQFLTLKQVEDLFQDEAEMVSQVATALNA